MNGDKIKLRRDTKSNWTKANPVLALGEPGVEIDTFRFKVGDGLTSWNNLSYVGGGGDVTITNNPDNVFLTSANDEITPKERTTSLSAKGHYIMRPTDNFSAKLKANYIHEIPFDVNLGGASVTIPANAVLKFTGGKITNGTLVLQNTYLDGDVKLGADVAVSGTCANLTAKQSWFEQNNVDGFIRMINSLEGTTTFIFSNGTYAPSERINKVMQAGGFISVDGNGCVLAYREAKTDAPYISIRPSSLYNDIIYLDSPISEGDNEIVVPDGNAFNVGDIIILRDYAQSSWNYIRNYQQGEFKKVVKINENTLQLNTVVFGNYIHTDGAYIYENGTVEPIGSTTDSQVAIIKPNLCDVRVSDLTIEHSGAVEDDNFTVGIAMYNCRVLMDALVVKNFRYGIILDGCLSSKIANSIISSKGKPAGGGDNYGVQIIGCQDVAVNCCSCRGGNHGITIGGHYGGEYCTVSRFITISGCDCEGGGGGINCHGATDFITYDNNHCDGMSISGYHGIVTNNIVHGIINIWESTGYGFKISNNVCEGLQESRGATSSYLHGFLNWVQSNKSEELLIGNNTINGNISVIEFSKHDEAWRKKLSNVSVLIHDNVVNGRMILRLGYYDCLPSSNFPDSDVWMEDAATLVITSNRFNIDATSTSQAQVYAKTIKIDENIIGTSDAGGMTVYSLNLSIAGNEMLNYGESPQAGKSVFNTGYASEVVFSGNRIKSGRRAIISYLIDNRRTAQKLLISDNTCDSQLALYDHAADSLYKSEVQFLRNVEKNKSTFTECDLVFEPSPYITNPLESDKAVGIVEKKDIFQRLLLGESSIQIPDTITSAYNTEISAASSAYIDVMQENSGAREYILDCVAAIRHNSYIGYAHFRIDVRPSSVGLVCSDHFWLEYPSVEYVFQDDKLSLKITNSDQTYGIALGIKLDFHRPGTQGMVAIKKGAEPAQTMSMASIIMPSVFYPVTSVPSGTGRNVGRQLFLNQSVGRPIWWDGSKYVFADGIATSVKREGTTAQRPTGSAVYVGFGYFDTTIGKPIFAKTISGDTVTWVDATGATV